MDLDNSFEVVVYHLLIGWMTDFGYPDEFYMVCTLV